VFGLEQVRQALGEPRIGVILLLAFLFIASFAAFESFFVFFGMALFPATFGLDKPLLEMDHAHALAAAPVAGRYLAGIGILSALIQGVLIRRLVKRFGETALAAVGPLVLAIGFAIVGVAGLNHAWSWVIVGCLVMPLGFGINNPSLSSLISRATPESEQGAFLGLNQSVLSLARICGPLLAGLVFEHIGPTAPFFTGTGILLVSTLFAVGYHRRFGSTFPRNDPAPAAAKA
jgi:dipeptide/tripeptide permease